MLEAQAEDERIERERVEQLACQFWQQRGSPDGSADDDWFRAEMQLRSEAHTALRELYAFDIERRT